MPDKIEHWPLDRLIPYAANARTHSDVQIAQISASMREFGWTNPVLVDGAGGIVAGHGRVLAARSLGLTECPVIVLAHLTEAQRRAYVIADNKLALNSGWDDGLLALELGALKSLDFDLGLTGFDDGELRALLPPADGQPDPDEAPEPPAVPVSRPGDLWLCGEHRLLCGDATSAEDVARLLGDARPHLMVTDPPYGVEYDPAWRNHAFRSDGSPSDGRAVGVVLNDDRADWSAAWSLFAGDVVYVWHGGRHASTVQASLEAAGFAVRSQIIWAKSRFVISRGHYHGQHEPCWYAVRKGKPGRWHGDRSQTTLWQIAHVKSETGHSTQKPVECMRRPIVNNSARGDVVYDPFLGSGTTMIAAQIEGRRLYGLELSPVYVDVAVRRWQTFAGGVATLEGDGRAFDAVAAERVPAAA